jgi:hypothetical protein
MGKDIDVKKNLKIIVKNISSVKGNILSDKNVTSFLKSNKLTLIYVH